MSCYIFLSTVALLFVDKLVLVLYNIVENEIVVFIFFPLQISICARELGDQARGLEEARKNVERISSYPFSSSHSQVKISLK
jgi:hypothetical protein